MVKKAEKIGGQLARIMSNICGSKELRRRLLSSVVHSVLLFGVPSWASKVKYVPQSVNLLNRAQRKILLCNICVYRIVSKVVTNILASTPDIMARIVKQQSWKGVTYTHWKQPPPKLEQKFIEDGTRGSTRPKLESGRGRW